ncbi:MAG: hypothetical protein NT027_07430 [Proteobacteria bacterium]|nr:hypothetical protein [Pseudomonadota bacterium]
MKKRITALLFSMVLSMSVIVQPKRAQAFGGEIPILLEILSNAVTQLHNLMTIVQQGRDTLNLTREINSGLNDTLSLIEAIKSRPDFNMYQGWQNIDQALNKIEQLYGKIPKSRLSDIQSHSDRAVAEGVAASLAVARAADSYDIGGRGIQLRAGESSPKGAARLTAQGVGVMVQVMNESLRAQSSSLKLQAQTIAVNNQKDKEETRQVKAASESLAKGMRSHKTNFSTPEF